MDRQACLTRSVVAVGVLCCAACGARGSEAKGGAAGGSAVGAGGNGQNGGNGSPVVLLDEQTAGAGGAGEVCLGENPPEWCAEGMLSTSGPACGDGEINQDSEDCDDGNSMPGDGCNGLCKVEPNFVCPTPGEPCQSTIACGDGQLAGGEVCDDGNTADGDGCAADCQAIEDGYYCPEVGAKGIVR